MSVEQSTSQLSLEILRQVLGGAPADRTLKRVFRREQKLNNSERKAISAAVYQVALHRSRLAYAIQSALAAHPAHRTELLLATYLTSHEKIDEIQALERVGLTNDADVSNAWRNALQCPLELPASAVERFALQRSIPLFVAQTLLDTYPFEEADLLMEHLNRPGPITLRAKVHPLKREQVAAQLQVDGIETRLTAHSPWGLHVLPPAQGKANLWGSSAFRQGLFEVQDEGSQLIAVAGRAQKNECVVDFCAGRGGKTLALAASMENTGRLVATDVDAGALRDLQTRLKRARATWVESLHLSDAPAQLLPAELKDLQHQADLVLVDAPCSSLGAWRRGPHQRWALQPADLMHWPTLQNSILAQASRLVRPGGRLLYATCTVLPAENQDVRASFLQSHPDFRPSPLPLDLAQGATELLLLPHRHGCDGFYLCHFNRDRG